MTNANVEHMVTSSDGQILSVKYKDGEKKLLVTPQTVVVTYVPGSKDDLKPGTKIFVSRGKEAAGRDVANSAHHLRQRRSRACVLNAT